MDGEKCIMTRGQQYLMTRGTISYNQECKKI